MSGKNLSNEVCELCLKKSRRFYCIECVRNGDFTHSSKECNFPERFAEKKLRLYQFERNKEKTSSAIKLALKDRLLRDRLIQKIILCKDTVSSARSLVEHLEGSLRRDKLEVVKLQQECQFVKARLVGYQQKYAGIRQHVREVQRKIEWSQGQYDDVVKQLQSVCKTRMTNLITYIFTVEEVRAPSCSWSTDSEDPLKSALAEASRTTYFKGHWIQNDPFGLHQYRIVNPTLPSSGDYSAYSLDVPDVLQRDNLSTMTNSSNYERKSSYSISAGLTYTAQLINLLAFFLNVCLPFRLCYSEFCTRTPSESRFTSNVAKLNSNVLALCLTQHIPPAMLNPKHTLQNVKTLLDSEHVFIGRDQVFDVDPNILHSFQESFMDEYCVEEEDEVDSPPLLSEDWETVNIPSESSPHHIASIQSRNVTASIAALFWRATGQSHGDS